MLKVNHFSDCIEGCSPREGEHRIEGGDEEDESGEQTSLGRKGSPAAAAKVSSTEVNFKSNFLNQILIPQNYKLSKVYFCHC